MYEIKKKKAHILYMMSWTDRDQLNIRSHCNFTSLAFSGRVAEPVLHVIDIENVFLDKAEAYWVDY